MWLLWLDVSALAWKHNGLVHTEPWTVEITTVDAQGAPPGAVQQAVRDALRAWTDDACLESLPYITVVDTDDNHLGIGDGRSLVSVDTTDPAHLNAVTYVSGSTKAFHRFGYDYRSFEPPDITMGPADWALADEVASGTCDGPALERVAYEMVAYALGLSFAYETDPTSFGMLPDCSFPVIGDDDRAGLQALYGSGVDLECSGSEETVIGFDEIVADLDDCTVTPYGASTLLDLRWVLPDGTSAAIDDVIVLTDPGRHVLEACGTFDVDPACDRPEVCVAVPRDFLVCELPVPALSALVWPDGTVEATDSTALTDDACVADRRWTLDHDGQTVEVLEGPERAAGFTLPEPGSYTLQLELLGPGGEVFSTSEPLIWAGTGAPTTGTSSEPPTGAAGRCGCAGSPSPSGPLGLVGLLVLARRRH